MVIMAVFLTFENVLVPNRAERRCLTFVFIFFFLFHFNLYKNVKR